MATDTSFTDPREAGRGVPNTFETQHVEEFFDLIEKA
jgi:hypothetical protein